MYLNAIDIKRLRAGGTITVRLEDCPYKKGRSYAVQRKKGGKGVGIRVQVAELHQEDKGYVLTLKPDRMAPGRFLTPLAGKSPKHPHDYTSDPAQAMHDEGEAVDELTQAKFSKAAEEAGKISRTRKREELRKLPTEDRLRLAKSTARAKRIDVSKHERVIERRVEAIEDDAYGNGDQEAA